MMDKLKRLCEAVEYGIRLFRLFPRLVIFAFAYGGYTLTFKIIETPDLSLAAGGAITAIVGGIIAAFKFYSDATSQPIKERDPK